jgi:hypothetical protein
MGSLSEVSKHITLTKEEKLFKRRFEWFWDGRRGAVKELGLDGKWYKDCDDRNNARRRDIMTRGNRDLDEQMMTESGVIPCYGRKYTLDDYIKAAVPPDVAFDILESNSSVGKEILNVIEPYGDGKVEAGDWVKIRTAGHVLNGKIGRLIHKRQRHLYEQFECKVVMNNGFTVILREDELTKMRPEVVV